jgi:hypothetical protein
MGEENIDIKYYGPVVEQGMWGIRSNQELRELYRVFHDLWTLLQEVIS